MSTDNEGDFSKEFRAAEIEFYETVNEELARMQTAVQEQNRIISGKPNLEIENRPYSLLAKDLMVNHYYSTAYTIFFWGANEGECDCFIGLTKWYTKAYRRIEKAKYKSAADQIVMRKCILLGLYWAGRTCENDIPEDKKQKLHVSRYLSLLSKAMKLWHGQNYSSLREHLTQHGHIPFLVKILNKWSKIIKSIRGPNLETNILNQFEQEAERDENDVTTFLTSVLDVDNVFDWLNIPTVLDVD